MPILGSARRRAAFLFNHLVEARPAGGPDRVFEFLVTCGALVRGSMMAKTTIPVSMTTPAGVAVDCIAWDRWAEHWYFSRRVEVDLAFHPFYEMRERAERRGWEWSTQEVPDGMVPRDELLAIVPGMSAVIGFEPWDLSQPSANPTVRLVHPEVVPDGLESGGLAVVGLPGSYCGAPVFSLVELDGARLRMVLLGVVGAELRGGASNRGPARALIPGGQLRTAAADVFAGLSAGTSWRGGE